MESLSIKEVEQRIKELRRIALKWVQHFSDNKKDKLVILERNGLEEASEKRLEIK